LCNKAALPHAFGYSCCETSLDYNPLCVITGFIRQFQNGGDGERIDMGQVSNSGKTILIVEDEALIRFDLVDFFEDAGFRVFDAANADAAIAMMMDNPSITIVLTDIQMPGSMDGIRLAHYIRDRYPPTLLVIASGAIRPAVSELPADAFFVPKPFDPYAVLRTIQQAA